MTAQLPELPSKERLEKIATWRETYGAGHNVMLPAEEAEALARFALAAYEQEPMMTDQAETLQKICNIFRIGIQAQTQSTILANVENAVRFADQLHAIEREFFMVPGEPDEDYPDDEPADVCLVNCWGSTTEQYVEQFRAALKKIAPPAPVAVPDEWKLSDAVSFIDEYQPPSEGEAALFAWNACRAAMLNHSGGSTEKVNQSEDNLEKANAVMPDYEGVAMTQRECFRAGLEAGKARVMDDWKQWIDDVVEYLNDGLETDGELEAEGSIEAKRLLAAAPRQEKR